MATEKHQYWVETMAIDAINILPQPRKSFDMTGIQELAESIANKGLLMPLIVARFTQKECLEYLQAIQHHYDIAPAIDSLKKIGIFSEEYLVLVDGERRYRALKYLDDVGCESCNTNNWRHRCLHHHFIDGKVPISLILNPSAEEALALQYTANKYLPPPPEEEAIALHRYYKFLTRNGASLSNRAFSRQVDRSEQTVRNALRFARLENDNIQKAVMDKVIAYGIAVELARLYEQTADEILLQEYFRLAVVKRYNVVDFKRLVSRVLENYSKSQQTLDLELEIDTGKVLKQKVRQEVLITYTAVNNYTKKIRWMIDRGVLGEDVAALNDKDILNILLKIFTGGKIISHESEKIILALRKRGLDEVPENLINRVNEIQAAN